MPGWNGLQLVQRSRPGERAQRGLLKESCYERERARASGPSLQYQATPIGRPLAAELFDHRARSAYHQGDDDLVFVSPYRGSHVNPKRYAETFRVALAKAEITGYVRPFHDGRHSAITNDAARAGREHALMTLAGHSDSRTAMLYTHLAGEIFREEAHGWAVRCGGKSLKPCGEEAAHREAAGAQ